MSVRSTSSVTYVLPIRQARVVPGTVAEMAAYLRSIVGSCCEMIVVDGSDPAVFAAHHEAWRAHCTHVRPNPRYRYLNGKVNGLFTGTDAAETDQIILGDDDVRYTSADVERMSTLLEQFDYVKPQNFFDPLPLHARIESARMLINRAVLETGDYPGTCGFRKSVLDRIGPYDGDVLFENEEMFRHFALHGAKILCANDFFVRKLPPTFQKFLEQRPRQSYEDLVMRAKTALFASFLPLGATIGAVVGRGAALGYFGAWSAAAIGLAWHGRRQEGAARYFPISSCLFAVPWILERGIFVYVALFWRLAVGGLPYWGRIVPKGTGPDFSRGGRALEEHVSVSRGT